MITHSHRSLDYYAALHNANTRIYSNTHSLKILLIQRNSVKKSQEPSNNLLKL